MARFPHELVRDGLFSASWTVRGPLITGKIQPPRGDRAGVYESPTLRLEYRHGKERRQNLEFRSPRLSREGDQISGEVRWAGPTRAVSLASNGTGSESVEMPVLSAGFLKRRHVLLAPHGQPLATVTRRSGQFDIDIPGAAFGEGGERPGKGKRRVYEAAIAMLLAANIDQELRRRARVAAGTAGAGAAAGAAAAARHMRKKRSERDG